MKYACIWPRKHSPARLRMIDALCRTWEYLLGESVSTALPDKLIANAFCYQIGPIVERQRQTELETRELTRLRDWLLPLLMNGQVRVA